MGDNATQISSSEVFTENDGSEWWGELDEAGLTNEQMYMILVENACTVELQGMPANPADHPITINPCVLLQQHRNKNFDNWRSES
ncbi:MAG: hypothetical protein J6W30_09745 [Bacteroidales bacterium]|nr:hypothetical protein [Bacteroidales bacterium]